MARLKLLYNDKIRKQLQQQFEYSSIMQVPRLEKITLNMGVGEAATDKKILTHAIDELTLISGQKALATKAKHSVAGFKIREGWPIGCRVTLRGSRMYEFLDRLISIAIPRIRDFRGLSIRSFDGTGNYNFGIKEQIVFPDIDYDKISAIRGLDIAITTSAKTNREGQALLAAFDFPFKEVKELEKTSN